MVAPLPRAVDALLRAQHGVIARWQAIEAGMSDAEIQTHVRAGRWRRAVRGVYTAFTGPPHLVHQQWVAVLATGPRAALSHDTAAHRHGLIASPPARVHVLAPHDSTPVHVRGVRLHRTRSARIVVGDPPTTSVADTLCDLAAAGWRRDELANVVGTAIRERLTDLEAMARAWEGRRRMRGASMLKALTIDIAGGSHSALELRYLRDVERRHGLPQPVRQHRADREGTTAFRDIHYPEFGLTVELDGRRHHGSFDARLRDLRRDRIAGDAGELTLRYGWTDVTAHFCAVAIEVAMVLRERGWSGALTRCATCP